MYVTEGVSEFYQATLDVASHERGALAATLLGERCVFSFSRENQASHRLCGIISRVEDFGVALEDRVARIVIVPELWLLSQRVNSRIFQELDTVGIVSAVLSSANLPAERIRSELLASYRVREYCAQYRESDLAFVQRLLEDEGISFYFDHSGERETLVLVDDQARFPDFAATHADPVHFVAEGGAAPPFEAIRRLDMQSQINPTGVTLRDWDHHHPAALGAVLTKSHPEVLGPREVYEYPAEVALRDYTRGNVTADYAARLALVRYDEHRAQDCIIAGTSNVTRVFAGAVLPEIATGPDEPANRYFVVRVEHQGEAPDALRARSGTLGIPYSNRFTARDAARPWRPKRAISRPRIHGAQTATVVGPGGEEIHTDAEGRIKVLFHWDRDGSADENASCWVRVAQSWSGAGWGAQFIPRMGMEVVVTFLEGNPDRPLVTGCVYNGTNPPPFAVPADRTRSGVRTRSSIGGDGFNELSFEDAKGEEQVYLQAQRDFDEVIKRNHSLRAGQDERLDVARHQSLHVGGNQDLKVDGSRRDAVAADFATQIGGKRETTVHQDDTLRVEGARLVSSLDTHTTANRNETVVVGGNSRREVKGMVDEVVKDDKTTLVHGNHTTVVGKHDARRTFIVHAEGRAVVQSSELTEIASEKELILRCGSSRIRITPERIEFGSEEGLTLRSGNTVVEVTKEKVRLRSTGKAVISAESINILTDQAQVKLTEEVKITGAMVKLNPPKADTETDEEPKPTKLTKLHLKDQEGRPLANQRFVIHFADNSEVAGVLDHEGRAELEVSGDEPRITFPGVSEVSPS